MKRPSLAKTRRASAARCWDEVIVPYSTSVGRKWVVHKKTTARPGLGHKPDAPASPEKLSDYLKGRRNGKRLSLTERGELSGIDITSLQRYEYGSPTPTLDTLLALAAALEFDPSELRGLEIPKNSRLSHHDLNLLSVVYTRLLETGRRVSALRRSQGIETAASLGLGDHVLARMERGVPLPLEAYKTVAANLRVPWMALLDPEGIPSGGGKHEVTRADGRFLATRLPELETGRLTLAEAHLVALIQKRAPRDLLFGEPTAPPDVRRTRQAKPAVVLDAYGREAPRALFRDKESFSGGYPEIDRIDVQRSPA